MGIAIEFYWPGQTDESLSAAHDEGGSFDDKASFWALEPIAITWTPDVEPGHSIRARYDLDVLFHIIRGHPDTLQPDELDSLPYRPPAEIAAAFDRLADGLEARDPMLETLVKESLGIHTENPLSERAWDNLRDVFRGMAGQARWIADQGIEGAYLAMYY